MYYDVQASTNLTTNVWNVITNKVVWSNNSYYTTNTTSSDSMFFRLVSRDDFTNTYSKLFELDNNVDDGVSIETDTYTFEISHVASTNYLITYTDFGASFALVKDNNVLRNVTRPFDMGSFYVLDLLLLSDGVNKVLTSVSQEKSNPLDVAFDATAWTEAEGTLSSSDLVGTWIFNGFSDFNLQDTVDEFQPISWTNTITALTDDQIQISSPELTGTATISGMEATFNNTPTNTGSAILHTMKIASNGKAASMYFVMSEITDPSDVSVTVVLGTKQ